MRTILFLFLAACAADNAPMEEPEDGPPLQALSDLGVVGECVIGANVMTPGGCSVELVCQEAGVLAFSCAPGDGGSLCACAIGDSMISVAAPADACSDPLTTARVSCGWSWL